MDLKQAACLISLTARMLLRVRSREGGWQSGIWGGEVSRQVAWLAWAENPLFCLYAT